MKFDEPVDEDDEFEMVSKSQTDLHFRISQSTMRREDCPKNPYGDREFDSIPSLYFDDGVRSVDYVLVWKKLIPPDVCDETNAVKIKEIDDLNKKETYRSEKREVFEENIQKEGLELENYVVDNEITFVKIHAPQEVLRRYAEILKLRLPMKEVSSRRILVYYLIIISVMFSYNFIILESARLNFIH